MTIKELREKKDQELEKVLAELREELHGLRFRDAVKQLKEVREIRRIKKDIAKILTIKNERSTTQSA